MPNIAQTDCQTRNLRRLCVKNRPNGSPFIFAKRPFCSKPVTSGGIIKCQNIELPTACD